MKFVLFASNLKRLLQLISFLTLFLICFTYQAQAEKYFVGKVISKDYIKQGEDDFYGPFKQSKKSYELKVKFYQPIFNLFDEWPDKEGKVLHEEYTGLSVSPQPGNWVILRVLSELEDEEITLFVSDVIRLFWIGIVFFFFLGLVVLTTGLAGFRAIGGLLLSILVLIFFIAPQILNGSNPALISLIGAGSVAVISLFIAHGFSKQSSLALGSVLFTLLMAFLVAPLIIELTHLSGIGGDGEYHLQLGTEKIYNMKGLLLGGIVIGTLGILDDVAVTQISAIVELKKANHSYGFNELFSSALTIGRGHIVSLINTLAFAYFGASMPILLAFTLNTTQPAWVSLNSEMIVEEIVRTVIGSSALILAMPISSALGALYYHYNDAPD